MDGKRTKVGVVGCGAISDIYLTSPQRNPNIEIAACADLDMERARAKARQHGVPKACTTAELLADPQIEIVLNLTIPKAHGEVALSALAAGKSVYNEKPLAVKREDARRMLKLAARKGLRVGGAPDTFLGAGYQTCRRAVDDGLIGEPVAATAFMMCPGHEGWHPSPEFYYKAGGGPLFDMGPYYITALVHLLGPVKRVTGMARMSFSERTIGSAPLKGQKIRVETPTHIIGVLEFAAGPLASVVMSFDSHGGEVPRIEVYGSQGTLSCPDPNSFRGPVRLRRAGEKAFSELPLVTPYVENSRGVGVADMACAIRSGRAHRAGAELTYHVLDVMQSVLDAAEKGRHVTLKSTCSRPAPLPLDLAMGALDD